MRVVLAVAGEPAVRDTLRNALELEDLIVLESTTAGALRRLAAFHVDLIVVEDSQQLGISAVPLLKRAAAKVPLALLTERQDARFERRARDAGVDTCLRPDTADAALHMFLKGRPALSVEPRVSAAHAEEDPAAAALRAHEHVLEWISYAAGRKWDLAALANEAVRHAARAFAATRCALILAEGETARIAGQVGYAASIVSQLQLSFGRGLMRHLNQEAAILHSGDAALPLLARRELELLHGRVAVPLLWDGQVPGALVLAEKATGGGYTPEERRLLILFGRCLSVLLLETDTRRHAAQPELARVVHRLSTGLITIGHDQQVRSANPSAERILGRSCDELIGRDVSQLGDAFAGLARASLADGSPRTRQVIRDDRYGTPIGASVSPLNGDGVAVVFARLPQSVGDPGAAETPFWQYLAERLAQEIKNPMVAVNTYAQLLPQKYESPEFREAFAATVQSEIGRINRVVEHLFAFAHESRLEPRWLDLDALLRVTLRNLDPLWRSREIDLVQEFAAPLRMYSDPRLLEGVCEQLARNAAEAMPKGGSLAISAKELDGLLEICWTNTGPAIADDDLPRIFLPFFSTRERGLGLGLALARRDVARLGGDISVAKNEPGQVSFLIRLPYPGDRDADHPHR
ncbi:MAG: PAS domain-containing protein [Candidatus Hydrogenedentes bacterium]|nr:PAS domain-containing protein [Candidatus Hydrogenedentota bacterium]